MQILVLMVEGVLTDLGEELELNMLHAQAESHALAHPTPTVEEELEWAVTELMTGNLEKGTWEGAVQVYDSCTVEVDGVCPHGYKSPLILLGLE